MEPAGPQPETREEFLLAAWRRAGRPGGVKLAQVLRRAGLPISQKEAVAFVRRQAVSQVFHRPPRSAGRVTAPHVNSKWQVDLIDYTPKDARANDGYRYALVVADVFSRRVAAAPMRDKTALTTWKTFDALLRDLGAHAGPRIVDTDVGGEFGGVFEANLRRLDILHVVKDPRQKDGLAVVDSAIGRLKKAIGLELAETRSEAWVPALRNAVAALNSRPLDHLLGAAPEDVAGNRPLQYTLGVEAGQDMLQESRRQTQAADRLRAAGKFRVLLPRRDWIKADQARYSETVHTVRDVSGGYVTDTEGVRTQLPFALPVGAESESLQLPRAVKGGDAARDEARREALRPFVEALKAHLSASGGRRSGVANRSLTLAEAGSYLATIPGYTDAVRRLKIHDVGFRAVAGLFDTDLELSGGGGALTRVSVRGAMAARGRRIFGKRAAEVAR